MPKALTIKAPAWKQDLRSNRLDEYLSRCIAWLFQSFSEISEVIVDSSTLEKFSAAKQRSDGIAGIKAAVKVSAQAKEDRSNFANKVLASFKNGPLFVSKGGVSKNSVEFLWVCSKDLVAPHVSDVSQIDYGKSVEDRLAAGGSSQSSRYPFAYYSFDGTMDELKRILKKVKFDGEADLKEAAGDRRIAAKCIVDMTIKGSREGTNKVSEIADAGALLDAFKKPLGIKSIVKYGKSYDFIAAIKNRSATLKAVRKAIESFKKGASLDKSVYAVLFNSILGSGGSDFRMAALKNSSVGDSTFGDVLKAQKTYGAVISELLIPFLLLAGYRTIDGKEILKGLPSDDEVVSVEFPQAKNNVLTDYDVGLSDASLVSTASGKRYAVSAKWTDGHNSPGLFTLLYDNAKMFGGKVLNEYAKKAGKKSAFAVAVKIVEDDGEHKAMPGKVLALARSEDAIKDRFLNKLAAGVDYDDMKNNAYWPGTKYSKKDQAIILKKISDGIGDLLKRAKEKQLQQIADLFPYSIQIVCDKKLAAILNGDKKFLTTIYDFMYGYYGEDVEFQQIQLNEDLSLKYFKKEPDVTVKNVNEYVEIESVSSIKKTEQKKPNDAISIAQPLRVSLLR